MIFSIFHSSFVQKENLHYIRLHHPQGTEVQNKLQLPLINGQLRNNWPQLEAIAFFSLPQGGSRSILAFFMVRQRDLVNSSLKALV